MLTSAFIYVDYVDIHTHEVTHTPERLCVTWDGKHLYLRGAGGIDMARYTLEDLKDDQTNDT